MQRYSLALAISVAIQASTGYSQTFATLVQFTGSGGTASGAESFGSLTLVGTALYGMTNFGGANGDGNVFSVGANGTNCQNVLSFTGTGGAASGAQPYGNLTLVGSELYGMTALGGAKGDGNVFSVGANGTNYQNLVSFTGTAGTASGNQPSGSLALVGSGLYGMTTNGGPNGYGNVFSVGSNGTGYQNLVSFTGSSGTASGAGPEGSLTPVGSGLYGMTELGGANGVGNIFSVGANGASYQNLVLFTGSGGTASGDDPYGSLTLVGTRLYGMTLGGGAGGYGNVFSVGTDGTGYQNLLSFTSVGGTANGWNPVGSLIFSGTALYGMTTQGGVNFDGNIFSVGLDGSGYQDLYDFTGGAGGGDPHGDLLLSSGTLFGMTNGGGIDNNGTVFAFALPTPEPPALALAGGAVAVLLGAYRWRRRPSRRGNRRPPAIATRPPAPTATPARQW
jgi:hypothetical protein